MGRGSDAPLQLETSSVTFAATGRGCQLQLSACIITQIRPHYFTALGDVSSASVNATNTTKKPLTFQIHVPKDTGLFVNPVVATLEDASCMSACLGTPATRALKAAIAGGYRLLGL
jgi:hypothetical protein